MIDVNYYTKLVFGNDINMINKLFGNYKFHSLFAMKKFLEELPNNNNLLDKFKTRINNEQLKNMLSQANVLSLSLDNVIENPFDFLNREVFPNIDMGNLLYDLNPKLSGGTEMVDCPCCNDRSTKAYVVKEGGENTGIIACNRLKECGEKTSIFNHVRSREGLDFISTIKFLSNQVGIDYDIYNRNREMHIEDNGVFQDKDYVCDSNTIIQKNINRKSKNQYGVSEFEILSPDLTKLFTKPNLMKALHNYNKYPDKDKIKLIYNYIKVFTMKEQDRKDMHTYLGKRGITIESAKDFGLLKANKINDLVNELKEIFGKDDLIRFNVLNEKGYWKYTLLTKDDEYIYNDSIVTFFHSIYSDNPTNIEFKFFGEKAIGSKRKAISMSNSEILDSNYYSNITIDNIKSSDKQNNVIWWNEGSLDVKCMNSMGFLSNGLIGAGKHFDKNLGLYKDKIHIICLDEDNAGIKFTSVLARKLRMIGVKQIYCASWNEEFGNDINDLLNSKNLDKIKVSKIEFTLNEDINEYEITYDIEEIKPIPTYIIEKAYKELEVAYQEASLSMGKDISSLYRINHEKAIEINDLVNQSKIQQTINP